MARYLIHHGIKGQRWGVKHGPPYPLDSQTSTRVRRSSIKSGSLHKAETDTSPSSTSHFSQEADLAKVNPRFSDFDSGTRFNCTYCSVAYDLRRRGYDVTANRSDTPQSLSVFDRAYPSAKQSPFIQMKHNNGLERERYYTALKDKMLAAGDGARGILTCALMDKMSYHTVAYEIDKGNVVILDPQSNTIYKNPDDFLQYTYAASFFRTDNIEPDYKAIKEMVS